MNAVRPEYEAWKAGVLSKVDPATTALIAIDLQRDFCSTDGALAALGSDVSPSASIVSRLEGFLPQVRPLVNFVAFFQLVYDPAEMSEVQKERLIKNGQPVVCRPNTRGCDLILTPTQDDLVFVKHRYSAFSSLPFQALLKERRIETVAVVGVDTHICVEGSVRHGYDLGFRMIVLSDLVATRRAEASRHDNSLALCERYFGLTMDSDAFVTMCDAHRRALVSVHSK
jgi:ureidoacrylate peracid hydrolase